MIGKYRRLAACLCKFFSRPCGVVYANRISRYGTYSGAAAINAGLDLEMPGVTKYRGPAVEFEMNARLIKQTTLDQRARRVLQFVERASRLAVSPVEGERNYPEDRALNRKLCASSIVLLKNSRKVLPLPKKMKKIALIGSHMRDAAVFGGGSAKLDPYYSVNLFDAIKEKLGPGVELVYEVGAYAHKMLPVIQRHLSNASIHFYNEPPSVKDRVCVGTEPLTKIDFQLMDYKNQNPKLNFDLFYAIAEADFTPDVSGIWEFGMSVYGTAYFYLDDELLIDGATTQVLGTSFFGRGTKEQFATRNLIAGKTYKLRIDFGSAMTSKMLALGVVSFGGGGARIGACPLVDVQEGIEKAVKAAAEADYTVLCTGLNVRIDCQHDDVHLLTSHRKTGKAKASTDQQCPSLPTSTSSSREFCK